MSSPPKVAAVCVNWNGSLVLPPLLESLEHTDYPQLEILVVDSASTDGSLALVPQGVTVLKMSENRGYAAALNAGVQHCLAGGSGPEYLLLLNNDLEVEPRTVSLLVEFAQQRGPGVFGPRVLSFEDPSRLDAAWGEVRWNHVLTRYHGIGQLDGEAWRQTRRVELLLGCALLVHRQVLETIGDFDESFFMYHEEVDFLYRCRQADVPVYYCPFAAVRHRSAHSTRRAPLRKTYWLRRNSILFLRKHRAGPWRWFRLLSTLSLSLTWNILSLQWKRAQAIARGAVDGFRGEGQAPSS